MLSDAETKNLLNRHFDLVILDGAFPECALGMAHVFRVPYMFINTVGFYTGSLQLAGNPSPYATTPVFFSAFTDEMDLYQRFLNTVYTMFAYSMHRVSVVPFVIVWSLAWSCNSRMKMKCGLIGPVTSVVRTAGHCYYRKMHGEVTCCCCSTSSDSLEWNCVNVIF